MTVRASRDTKLVGLPKKTFLRLVNSHASIGITIARMIARKSETSRSAQPAAAIAHSQSKSLAIVAADDGIDLTGFASRLLERQFAA